jgi:hypothetical protein
VLELRLLISWIITILICIVVAFNIVAFLVIEIQKFSECLRRRRERMRKFEDRVVRLKPLPPQQFEMTPNDVNISNDKDRTNTLKTI